MRKLFAVLIVVLAVAPAIIFTGCTHVPRESAHLSVEVGRQISEAQRSHSAVIDQYIEQRRGRSEDFMRRIWTPRFIKNLLARPQVEKAMKTEICKAGAGEMDRALVLQELVEAIWKEVEKKRLEIFTVIDKTERELKQAVDAHYWQMHEMNNAVTANLRSASEGLEFERGIRKAAMRPLEKVVPLEKADEMLDKLLE